MMTMARSRVSYVIGLAFAIVSELIEWMTCVIAEIIAVLLLAGGGWLYARGSRRGLGRFCISQRGYTGGPEILELGKLFWRPRA
jgi:hypothetical protein